MVSQYEALTKDQANIGGYCQKRGCQANRQSPTTPGSSFSEPFGVVLKLDPTFASTNATAFIKGETPTGKEVNVRAIHERDAGRVIGARNPDPSDVLVYGDVTVCFSGMEVHRKGQLVALTLQEFKTLAYLLKNARRVVSRDELLNEVWGYECYPSTRTVDNHILRLRKKLEPEPARPKHFRTVHGIGYKFLP
jgi:Transcriptional regulatory protein, C terminal